MAKAETTIRCQVPLPPRSDALALRPGEVLLPCGAQGTDHLDKPGTRLAARLTYVGTPPGPRDFHPDDPGANPRFVQAKIWTGMEWRSVVLAPQTNEEVRGSIEALEDPKEDKAEFNLYAWYWFLIVPPAAEYPNEPDTLGEDQ